MATLADLKHFSLSRDGLMSIKFSTNIRDTASDIRRKQMNELSKLRRSSGAPYTRNVTLDQIEDYEVFNSDPELDNNKEISIDELLNAFTVPKLKEIGNAIKVRFPSSINKNALIQILKINIQQNKTNLSYVKNQYKELMSELRAGRQRSPRDVNKTLLISNRYKYKRSDFDGMTLKQILRSVFDIDEHLLFLYKRILKEKSIPLEKVKTVTNALNKTQGMSRAEINTYLTNESIKNDRILKSNSHLVLQLLFASKNPFYLDKKKYTILAFHQENGPTQDPEEGIVMNTTGPYEKFEVYPVEIYLELSDLEPDKITDSVIQKANCHIRKEKMRKNWHDIWNTPNTVFERKHLSTLKRNVLRGGNKKTRKNYKPKESDDLYLAVSGDIMFGRYVGKEYHPINIKNPFREIKHILKPTDLTIMNLETPLFDGTPTWWKKYKLPRENYQKTLVAPTSTVKELVEAGINFVSLANNHADDAGYEGFTSTLKTLDSENIMHAGVNMHGDPFSPKIINVKNRPIVLFSVTFIRNFGREWGDSNEYSPPLAYINSIQQYNHLLNLIKETRKKIPNAFIILSVHWGVQYKEEIEPWQENAAKDFVDAGVNCLLGHHPHVLQKVSMYKGAIIFYSLGNLLFDHNYNISGHASKKNSNTQKGAIYTFTVTPNNSIKNLNKIKTVSTPTGVITGGSKNRVQNGGTHNPASAVIEYLNYIPLQSQKDVDKFYKKVDRDWGDFKSGTNMLNIFSKGKKKVNSIDEVLKAVEESKKTTFCNRQTGDGDCEDTADKVLEIIKHDPNGKYTVSSLRFEYYLSEDEDETPEFVQNHGFLVFYNDNSKDWFKTGVIKY